MNVVCPKCQGVVEAGDGCQEQTSTGPLERKLTAAQERIRELEARLCDCEQELEAVGSIIEEQDARIEELRVQLETADEMLDMTEEARRRLERRLADSTCHQHAPPTPTCVVDEREALQVVEDVQKGRLAAPLPPDDAPDQGAVSDARSRAIVEALAEQWRLRNAK